MNDHERGLVSAFIIRERRHRFRHILDSGKKRIAGLDRLNHCNDFDPEATQWLVSDADVTSLLRTEGSPESVYLISAEKDLDGQSMPLEEAISELGTRDWGAVVSCIPGKLAFYRDECGMRKALLRRK
jgi:hypothetical protein